MQKWTNLTVRRRDGTAVEKPGQAHSVLFGSWTRRGILSIADFQWLIGSAPSVVLPITSCNNYTGWRKKTGPMGHPMSLQIFWKLHHRIKLHDRIAWKLVNFCNIICWTLSLTFCLKISSRCGAPSENTASVVYSHCTNRFEHHTVAVFSLGGGDATARWNF